MATHTERRATIGTVSEGTLRSEDLIQAFTAECDALGIAWNPVLLECGLSEAIETLTELLEEAAPPYCYFGTLEGDGACFGFWLDHEALEEAQRVGFELDDGRIVTDDGHIIEISDHGNVEIWKIECGESVASAV